MGRAGSDGTYEPGPRHALTACESCDLLHQERPLEDRQDARCVRCGGLLFRGRPRTLEHTFALSLAALALLVVANVYPFLTLNLEGQVRENRIITGVLLLWESGYAPLAVLILWASILAPLGRTLMMLYVTGGPLLGSHAPGIAPLTRFLKWVRPWAMLDVYMLALVVALVKLAQMADVELELGAFFFVALFVMLTLLGVAYDRVALWDRVAELT